MKTEPSKLLKNMDINNNESDSETESKANIFGQTRESLPTTSLKTDEEINFWNLKFNKYLIIYYKFNYI